VTDARLAIIVLAAGQGTRMRSSLPKLLHPLAGMPMISHVLATARALDAAHIVSVVRYERDRVAAVIAEELPESIIVDQDDIPGTGRAVEQAVDALPGTFDGDVLVINGDVPLLDAATLAALIQAHRTTAASATVLSAIPADATGYGRIIRSKTDCSTASSSRKTRRMPNSPSLRSTLASTSSASPRCGSSSRSSPQTMRKARSTSPMSSACSAARDPRSRLFPLPTRGSSPE